MFCQTDDKSPPKRVWLGSRDTFLHAQLWTRKISPRHAIN